MENKPIIDNSIVGKRSIQDLSCHWTGSADFGRIVPIQCTELLGTDNVVTCSPRVEVVPLPLASPTFGSFDCYLHYFFVPTRLLVTGYRDFLNNQGVYKDIEMPYVLPSELRTAYWNLGAGVRRQLFKHWTSMGLPAFFNTKTTTPLSDNKVISLLPFRAYRQIWWDYYRDPEVYRDDNYDNFMHHDFGHIDLTLGTNVDLFPLPRNLTNHWIAELFSENGTLDSVFVDKPSQQIGVASTSQTHEVQTVDQTSNNLRKIEALTRFAERLSMSGKRSIDMLYARYGVKPEWDKLNMCQYVGGAKQEIAIDNLLSQADTTAMTESLMGLPLGAQAGVGYCRFSDLDIHFEAHEPGYLLGLISIMPRTRFVQGLAKEWNRRYREDFFQKHLEHVGQVAVAKDEIAISYGSRGDMTDPSSNIPSMKIYDSTKDGQTFAFTEPYYEYKRGVDVLAGDFMWYHNSVNDTGESYTRDLQYMQSMEMFVDFPLDRTYNEVNMQIDPVEYNRVFSYQGGTIWSDTDDHFHVDVQKTIKIDRPMDGYAVPTLETTEDPHQTKTALSTSVEL